MKKWIKWAAVAAVGMTATSCTVATEATREVLDQLVRDGAITPEHRETIMASMANGWEVALGHLMDIGAGAILAYTGINIRRGPPTRSENVAKKRSGQVPPAQAAADPAD